MRQWMADPSLMCRKHLLGEHVEHHMFIGALKREKNVNGYLEKGLLEPRSLFKRHEELVKEMKKRGYKHSSPLTKEDATCISYLTEKQKKAKINAAVSYKDLVLRCPECFKLMMEEIR